MVSLLTNIILFCFDISKKEKCYVIGMITDISMIWIEHFNV